MRSVTILGTGLIGTSIALALRRAGFDGTLTGLDREPEERARARSTLAFDDVSDSALEQEGAALDADIIVLATPVLAILDWIERLAPRLRETQLVTDTGSTNNDIARHAAALFHRPGRAHFLPGHPMAGKETSGAAVAEDALFENAMWLFTPIAPPSAAADEWRHWVGLMGARTRDLEAARHDELCAWVSHLPQFVSTALAALLEARFADTPEMLAELNAIGGRALRETTRLGASPYSMWRDVALTNTAPVAGTLLALEQELAHLRENLRTPELREEFTRANRFRARRP